MKIKYQLLSGILGVIIVSMIILSAYITIITTNNTESLIETNGLNYTQAVSEEINSWILARKDEVETYSRNDLVKRVVWDQEVNDYLSQEWTLKKDVYENFLISDKQGNFNTVLGVSGNISQRDYFPQVMAGETVVSEPIIAASGGLVIIIATPIYNKQNHVSGLFLASITLESLNNMVIHNKLSENGYAFLLDKSGLAIAHPNPGLLATNILDHPNQEIVEGGKIILSNDKGVVSYLGILTTYSIIPSTGWKIGIAAIEKEIYAPIKTMTRNMILFFVITSLIVGSIIYLIAHKISKRIAKVVLSLEEKAKLRFKKGLEEKGINELNMLNNSLCEMTEKISNFISRIYEITQEVSASSEQLSAATTQLVNVNDEIDKAMGEVAHSTVSQTKDIEKIMEGNIDLDKMIKKNDKNGEELVEALDTITKMKDSALEISKELNIVVEQSSKGAQDIVQFLDTNYEQAVLIQKATANIEKIAAQTKLLSLNAAIEAAKSGEAGKGFSVIAESITKLSQETGIFNDNIVEQADLLVKQSQRAQKVMEGIGVIVQKQSGYIKETNKSLNTIADKIDSVGKIATNLKEMNIGIVALQKTLSDALNNLSASAQENTASTEEVVASVQEQSGSFEEIAESALSLAKLAEEMNEKIGEFEIREE